MHGGHGGRPADGYSERGRRADDAVGGGVHQNRRTAGGQRGQTAGGDESKNTVFSIKRFMGRKYDEMKEEIKRVPYEVVRASTAMRMSKSATRLIRRPKFRP